MKRQSTNRLILLAFIIVMIGGVGLFVWDKYGSGDSGSRDVIGRFLQSEGNVEYKDNSFSSWSAVKDQRDVVNESTVFTHEKSNATVDVLGVALQIKENSLVKIVRPPNKSGIFEMGFGSLIFQSTNPQSITLLVNNQPMEIHLGNNGQVQFVQELNSPQVRVVPLSGAVTVKKNGRAHPLKKGEELIFEKDKPAPTVASALPPAPAAPVPPPQEALATTPDVPATEEIPLESSQAEPTPEPEEAAPTVVENPVPVEPPPAAPEPPKVVEAPKLPLGPTSAELLTLKELKRKPAATLSTAKAEFNSTTPAEVIYSWTKKPGIDEYEVWWSKKSADGSVFVDQEVVKKGSQLKLSYNEAADVTVKVRGLLKNGQSTAWSDTQDFIVRKEEPPQISQVKVAGRVINKKKDLNQNVDVTVEFSKALEKDAEVHFVNKKTGEVIRHHISAAATEFKTQLPPGGYEYYTVLNGERSPASAARGELLDVAHKYEPPKTSFMPVKAKPKPKKKKPKVEILADPNVL